MIIKFSKLSLLALNKFYNLFGFTKNRVRVYYLLTKANIFSESMFVIYQGGKATGYV